MSAYLISPDAYCTFEMLFRAKSAELKIEELFRKYKYTFVLNTNEIDLSKINRIIEFMIAQMVMANSQNIYQMYNRPDNPMDVPLSQAEVKEYLQEGLANRKWLRAVENNPQLIVKALSWYLHQTSDRQDHTPIYRLIEEINGKFAVQLVKEMPGNWQIPNADENIKII
jgi:hypothetical protein